jgi:hypothetical protein
MAETISADEIRRSVGGELSEAEVIALAEWHAGIARGVSQYPAPELRGVEPPLRSTPGPRAMPQPPATSEPPAPSGPPA